MKDLFEDLNKAVPTAGGTKASKWEILSKGSLFFFGQVKMASTNNVTAIDYIRMTQNNEIALQERMVRLQREADYAREAHKENDMLKTEIQVMHQHLRRLDSNAPHVYGHFTQQLNQQGGAPPPSGSVSLPPLNPGAAPGPPGYGNGTQAPPGPGAMQGVEYGGYGR